ncbi:MAG TPA: LuxR C-terminal-related transcriptional regulator [Anaerolineales bacterium]|nr:LuxR C-terminal-related transcriptional regulator [Anaerolineales bacterium]HLO28631.1 LuxR C-terminal-related transcriptional regulator [Anaerolineales bacterium]
MTLTGPLSKREAEVAKLLLQGKSNKQIALTQLQTMPRQLHI